MENLKDKCKKCNRLPAEHLPVEMHQCYGVEYLIKFIEKYDNRKNKAVLIHYIIHQEISMIATKFIKKNWIFFQNFKMNEKIP